VGFREVKGGSSPAVVLQDGGTPALWSRRRRHLFGQSGRPRTCTSMPLYTISNILGGSLRAFCHARFGDILRAARYNESTVRHYLKEDCPCLGPDRFT
jgi:hypothetical protein